MSEHNLISVDIAKNVFQLCAMTDRMKIVFNGNRGQTTI
jgi:hypothetical protein